MLKHDVSLMKAIKDSYPFVMKSRAKKFFVRIIPPERMFEESSGGTEE